MVPSGVSIKSMLSIPAVGYLVTFMVFVNGSFLRSYSGRIFLKPAAWRGSLTRKFTDSLASTVISGEWAASCFNVGMWRWSGWKWEIQRWLHDSAFWRASGLSYCSPQPPAKAVPENHGSDRSDCSPLLIITDAWFK